MKKILFGIILIIIIVPVIVIIMINLKDAKIEYWIEEVKELNYFTILSNNKVGVIDKKREYCNKPDI